MKLKMSPLVEDAAGKDGSLVIRRSRSGPVATPRTYPKQTASARSSAAKKNLGAAASEFANLDDDQIASWNAFGAGRTRTNEVNGQKYAQTGFNAYVELATVFKMASPGAATPATPPTTAYAGDALGFSVQAGTGVVAVTGTGATSSQTRLEVLLQPLKSRARRTQKKGFVSQGFFALTAQNLYRANVAVPAGVYAVAVRYVNVATGQATTPQILDRATVALSVEDGGREAAADEAPAPAAKAARPRKAA